MGSLLGLPADLVHEILVILPPSGICCLEKTRVKYFTLA